MEVFPVMSLPLEDSLDPLTKFVLRAIEGETQPICHFHNVVHINYSDLGR